MLRQSHCVQTCVPNIMVSELHVPTTKLALPCPSAAVSQRFTPSNLICVRDRCVHPHTHSPSPPSSSLILLPPPTSHLLLILSSLPSLLLCSSISPLILFPRNRAHSPCLASTAHRLFVPLSQHVWNIGLVSFATSSSPHHCIMKERACRLQSAPQACPRPDPSSCKKRHHTNAGMPTR